MPPASLGPYLRELAALMARHGVDGLMYGHFGDGCVHARIDFPLRDRPRVLRSFTEDAAQLAASYGGSASGEHGDGRARGELLPLMYSAEAIGLMRGVKRLFDPGNLLNPGIIVDPAPLDADLRVPLALPLRRGLGFAYPHDAGDFTTAVHRCMGVGKCRADTTASGGVMCPSYLATRDEKDSTRGRARVLQELANGTLVSGWDAPEVAESLDLCLSCKGCSSRLPGGHRHGHVQGRGALPAVPPPAPARPRTTPWAGCPAGRPWCAGHRGWPGWRTRRCASRPSPRSPSASAASTTAATCRSSRRRASASGSRPGGRPQVPASGAPVPARPAAARGRGPRRPQARVPVGGHVHQRVLARGRPGRRRRARGRGLRGQDHRAATSAAA